MNAQPFLLHLASRIGNVVIDVGCRSMEQSRYVGGRQLVEEERFEYFPLSAA
jgi:hypothetical protein